MSERVQDTAAAQPQGALCEPVPKQAIALGAFLLCSGLGFLLYAVLNLIGRISREQAGGVSACTPAGTCGNSFDTEHPLIQAALSAPWLAGLG